jgi:hypothetical protein
VETAVEGVTEIERLGWRQGSVLPPALFSAVQNFTGLAFAPNHIVPVVVAQDCDVVHPSLSAEPTVEIVRAVRVDEPNGALTRGKSVRRLHLPFRTALGSSYFEIVINERCQVDRRILAQEGPDGLITLAQADVRILATWCARRYRRHSFPTAFGNRLREPKTAKRLNRLFAQYGRDIESIWLLIDPSDELPETESYALVVYVLVQKGRFDGDAERERIEKEFLDPFRDVLLSTAGISLKTEDLMLVSEEDISLHDIRFLRRLDLDYLSVTDDAEAHAA